MKKVLMLLGMAWGLTLSPTAASQPVVKYHHTDALGSVVVVTDANRNVIERREYEPYGAQLTPVVRDGPGYTGHVQDAVTGLVYMQQRYYDPQIGRFLSVDPVTAYDTGDMRLFNRYAYAANNPYKFTDPDGRLFDAVLDVGFAAYSAYVLAKDPSWTNAAALGADIAAAAVPGVTGAGVAVRAGANGVDAVRGANEAADASRNIAKREAGSYTNTHESGKTYDGKGSRERSQESGRRVERETGDKHTATDWTPASNSREEFKQESQRLDSHGGPRSDSNHNRIESPGRKMREEDLK